MRRAPFCAVVVLCAGALASAQSPTPAPLVFAARANSVFIDVSVSLGSRNLSGLTANDFVLRDNGVRAPFELVSTDSLPIKVALVFDTSSSMSGAKIERLRIAAGLFIS